MTGLLRALQRPRRLVQGDRVAVVASSGPLEPERLDRGVALLRSWGLHVHVGQHALDCDPAFPHLAGSDTDRARDFEEAWCDPDIRAVFVGRGGSGAARIVELLDWERMRAAGAKILVGFSDVTTLHQAVASFLGVASLFGPMPATLALAGEDPDHISIEHLHQTLFEPDNVRLLTAADLFCVVDGRAEGIVVGGTVSLLTASIGAAEHRRASGGIAVLEDVAEPAYRLDSHLTQLLRTGWFDGVRGVVLGSWTDCGDDAVEMVASRLRGLDVPVLAGLPFGHCTRALTVPLGGHATLDASAGTLLLAEPALA